MIKLLPVVITLLGAPVVLAQEKTKSPNIYVYFFCEAYEVDYTVMVDRRVLGKKVVSKQGKYAPCVDAISGQVAPGEHLLTVKSKKLGASGKLKIKVEKDAWILTHRESATPKKIEFRQEAHEPAFE